jgi:DNA-binding Xre family transcriptional regulator
MISYEPLFYTLEERGMKISHLRGTVLHAKTIANINKGQSVNLRSIADICRYLNVPIEKVVEIKLDREE